MPAAKAVLFTDGFRQEAGVGAAAVGSSKRTRASWTYTQALPGDRADVFDAELWAIHLGLKSTVELCEAHWQERSLSRVYRGDYHIARWKRIEVLSDSQAALQRLQAGWKKDRAPGQSVCDRIRSSLRRLEAACPGV